MSPRSNEHRKLEVKESAVQTDSAKTSEAESPREEQIRIRAYEIYIERGGQPGYDLDDWLQAERELEPKVRSAETGQ